MLPGAASPTTATPSPARTATTADDVDVLQPLPVRSAAAADDVLQPPPPRQGPIGGALAEVRRAAHARQTTVSYCGHVPGSIEAIILHRSGYFSLTLSLVFAHRTMLLLSFFARFPFNLFSLDQSE